MKNKDLCEVALVILNYNAPDLTISATRHILAQETGIHVVITDNASTDGSLQKFKDVFGGNSEVSVIETGVNGGYAKGNNYGIAYAEKIGGIHYIGVMNPDVELDAKELRLLIKALKENPSLGLVTGRTVYNGEIKEPNPCACAKPGFYRWIIGSTLIGSFIRYSGKNARKISLLNYGFYPKDYFSDDVTIVYAVQGCCFFSRLTTLQIIGRFDERTFLYCEEEILAEKILRAGLHNAVIKSAWIRHNHKNKDTLLLDSKKRLFHTRCNYESRLIYLREYSNYGCVTKALIALLWKADFLLRQLLVPLFFC